jgi:LysM repeat protein
VAPVALALFAVFFFAVILGSGSPNKRDSRASGTSTKRAAKSTRKGQRPKGIPATYSVKIGDNLPRISRKTGLSVAKIQDLNPQLDPYGLQAGQKIKLHE